MPVNLKGAEVSEAIVSGLTNDIEDLNNIGIIPTLAIVRIGERPDDISYERGAIKKLKTLGIKCNVYEYPETISENEFIKQFNNINDDKNVHGILLFRPLPKHINESNIKLIIHPEKDMDGMSPINVAKIFSGDDSGIPPCTPEAVMDTLDYYRIEPQGKRITIIGRSMVVGKPLAMMLIKKNATVTICHTKTKNIEETCKNAEILIAAAGKARMVTTDYISKDSILIDVGINVDNGKLCGDIDFQSVSEIAGSITPVPGGIGTVTTAELAKHLVKSAKLLSKNQGN